MSGTTQWNLDLFWDTKEGTKEKPEPTDITTVKMLWTHEVHLNESTTNFDHSDGTYHCL